MPKPFPCPECNGPTTIHCPQNSKPCGWWSCNTCDLVWYAAKKRAIAWPKGGKT